MSWKNRHPCLLRAAAAAARVLQDAAGVGLGLPRRRDRGEVRVLAEADAPPVAPAPLCPHVAPRARAHRPAVGLPTGRQPVPWARGGRVLPGAAPVS